MIQSYSALCIFTAAEKRLLFAAEYLIDRMPPSPDVRCHELVRAVAMLLGAPLVVQDGKYGSVDHSWLWIHPPPDDAVPRELRAWNMPTLLDVYAVGRLPMVQLVDMRHSVLPHAWGAYRPGPERTDIDMARVEVLIQSYRGTPTAQLLDPRGPHCPECDGDLGGLSLGRLEQHKSGCSLFPL